MFNRCIWSIHRTLTGIIPPGQSVHRTNDIEGVHHISQKPSTEASQSGAL